MNVLLLEDDVDLGQAVADHLEAAGHQVHWCKLIAQARQQVAAGRDSHATDVALVDLNLPDGDALALLRQWRSAGLSLPVIALTARDQVSDRILGLQAGADDYLVKPFDLDELLARIDAVRRRGDHGPSRSVGRLEIDLAGRRVRVEGHAVDVTAMEWAVLSLLARSSGRICSREQIESQLRDDGMPGAGSNSLEVIVSRLRRKLGADAISTHRGLGYRLDG